MYIMRLCNIDNILTWHPSSLINMTVASISISILPMLTRCLPAQFYKIKRKLVLFLNQAGTWFLEIAFVHVISLFICSADHCA